MALDGNYDDQTNFPLLIKTSSNDPKYTNLTITKSVVVTPKAAIIPGLIGIPQESLVVEGSNFQYKLTLTLAPDSKFCRCYYKCCWWNYN